jgi:hypothetical protein
MSLTREVLEQEKDFGPEPQPLCKCGHEFDYHDGTTNSECGAYTDIAETRPCPCGCFAL